MKIRPFKLCDGEALCRWVADEVTFTRWCANLFQYPLTMEQLETYRAEQENNPKDFAMTALDENDAPIGHVILRCRENKTVYIGFVVMAPQCRGKGLGAKWVTLLSRYCFHALGAETITLDVFDNNPAAWRCYQKVGYRITEEEPNCFPFQNEKWGRYGMRLDKADFKA